MLLPYQFVGRVAEIMLAESEQEIEAKLNEVVNVPTAPDGSQDRYCC